MSYTSPDLLQWVSMRRMPWPVALFIVSLALVAVMSRPVAAHSVLIDACPFAGDVVNDVDTIELSFSTALVEDSNPPPVVSLAGDLGRTDIEVGPIEFITETELRIDVPEDLEPGLYIVRYKVISADGDDNTGGFEFTLDPDATEARQCGEGSSGDGSSFGGWTFLGIGLVAVVAVGWLLRPKSPS